MQRSQLLLMAAALGLAGCAHQPRPPPHHYVTDRFGERLACYPREAAAGRPQEYDCLPTRPYAYHDPFHDPFWHDPLRPVPVIVVREVRTVVRDAPRPLPPPPRPCPPGRRC